MTPTLLPWGLLTDRVGERIVLPLGLATGAVALACAGIARGFEQLVLLLVAAGALSASVNAASGRAVMQWFDPSERGLALGIRQANVPLGGLCRRSRPAAARRHRRPRLGVLAARRRLRGRSARRRGPPPRAGARTDAQPAAVLASPSRPLRQRSLWLISWGSGLVVVGQIATMSFTVLFLQRRARLLDRRRRARARRRAGARAASSGSPRATGRTLRRQDRAAAPARARGVGDARTGRASSPGARLGPRSGARPGRRDRAVLERALLRRGRRDRRYRGRAAPPIGLQQTFLGIAGIVAPIGFAALVSATSWRVAFLVAALFPLAGWAVIRPSRTAKRPRVRAPLTSSTPVTRTRGRATRRAARRHSARPTTRRRPRAAQTARRSPPP